MVTELVKFDTERDKASRRLGLDGPAAPAGITAFIKPIGKWQDILIEYVSHLASTSEGYRMVLQLHGMASNSDRRALWPEDYLAQAGIDPSVFLGDLTRVAHQVGGAKAATLISLALPKVVQASVKAAKNVKSGAKDREMVFKMAGALPTPKGATVIVNTHGAAASAIPGQTSGQEGQAMAALPPFEDTMTAQMRSERPHDDEVIDAEFVDDI